MPSYDFASIDESDSLKEQYNWGYDPYNYNWACSIFPTVRDWNPTETADTPMASPIWMAEVSALKMCIRDRNDSWPVVSWSSIDYYGNWEALHYQAKRAFAPILINPIRQNDSLNIYLISDCPDTKDPVSYTHLDVYKRQAYSWLPVARLNCPKAMAANVYEKILYGSTNGLPERSSEKYQL